MRIVLAPMEGLADVHLRRLITAQGGFDWVVSEFVRVVDKLYPERVFHRVCPELMTQGETTSGTPLRVQLLGSDMNAMAENAARAVELGSFGIDINFGCPSKTVNRRQGGAVLLKEPETLFKVVNAVRCALPKSVIVSAKMRLGFDDTSLMLDNAQAIEDAGADELTVHARTRKQKYNPPVHWHELGTIRDHINIPMLANGDINSLEAYQACRSVSGIDDIMIGRGAVKQPNLAQTIRGERPKGGWQDVEPLLVDFWFDVRNNLIPRDCLGRIKQWLNYLRQQHPEAQRLFEELRMEKDEGVMEARILQLSAQTEARIANGF